MKLILTILFNLMSLVLFCQITTVTIQPNSEQGKDAYLRSLDPDVNRGDSPDLLAHSWTNGGNIVNVRSLIDFDLSELPNTAHIINAKITLYSVNSVAAGHHEYEENNSAFLERVLEPWNENLVTWNNQPITSQDNKVILPTSTESIQDYTQFDVTNLLRDALNSEEGFHGFLFKLQEEDIYRRMLFASSDYNDPSKHPKLEISYINNIPTYCDTLFTNEGNGKDAFLRSLDPDMNRGDKIELLAHSWTNSGNEVDVRSIFTFNFEKLPSDINLLYSSLSLYSFNSPAVGHHENLVSNAAWLERVIEPWEEYEVTWNNQPMTTSQNRIELVEIPFDLRDLININVTDIVNDMIEDNKSMYGFLFRQKTEEVYSRMLFASGDHPDHSLNPKLEVCYEVPSNNFELKITNNIILFPSVSNNEVTINIPEISELNDVNCIVFNSQGQIMCEIYNMENINQIEIKNYNSGIYFVTILEGKNKILKRLRFTKI